MDRRNFRVVHASKLVSGKQSGYQINKSDFPKECGGPNLQVLQELGNQLQVKAEKMRLLAKAEEGLEQEEFNPYATVTVSPQHGRTELYREKMTKTQDEDSHATQNTAPTSVARRKRREKRFQAQLGNPSKVNIKQYRPGYTWNKGGRMKELRIRHLARKFLWIWKKEVFGRITPSQACAHYRRRLLKKCYRAWNSVWWELRKEWRLVVRAECHHRFVLFTKTFKAWKEFIVIQRVKNKKIALAEKHACYKTQKKYLDAWLLFVENRRSKIERKKQAVTFHNDSLIRKYWTCWKSVYELCQHRQHMEVVALQFWAYRLQAQHWLIWQHKISVKKQQVQHQFKAVRHHNTVIVRKCLQAWLRYWSKRQERHQEKVLSEKIYHYTLVNRCFHIWQNGFRFRQAVQERQGHMNELAERFHKRRMITHWKHYIDQIHEERELFDIARDHHNRKLLMAGFSAFRLSVVQKKLKMMRIEMADQLRYKQLLQYGWNTWMLRCEDKEELQIVVQSQKAWKHYKLVLLRKCLYQLYNYAVWRQNRQNQYARADAHFYMTEVPKFMFAWKIFVQLMKNKRENDEKCAEFRRENLQARFFFLWVSEFEASRDNRMNERMAILHYDEHLAQNFFSKWKQTTVNKQMEQENEEVAAAHYNEVLLYNHLKAWRLYILELKKSQQQDVEASTHYTKRLLKTCLRAWTLNSCRSSVAVISKPSILYQHCNIDSQINDVSILMSEYTRRKKQKNEKCLKARQHYNGVLCKKMVQMWLHYVDTQRCIHQRVKILYHRQCQRCLRSAFLTWRENVVEQKAEKQAELLADRHKHLTLLSKVFKCWHRFAAIHAYKKSETRQWVTSAREDLNSKVQKVYFMKWKENFIAHKDERMKLEKADLYYKQRIQYNVIHRWKTFNQESIRKKLLKKQSEWFLSVRLKARYFIAWKHVLGNAEIEKERTNLALWHWCLTLHRKVLIAWYMYTQHRKEKKALVAAAMERHRQRLLREGVKKWLCVADDLSAMRKNFAAQQQAQTAFDVSRRVLKIGLYWKHWAAKRSRSRLMTGEETPHSLHSLPVLPKGDYSIQSQTKLMSGEDTQRSLKSMPDMPRGDNSVNITPRSVISVSMITETAKNIELKKANVPFPIPSKTASPGRPVSAVSRISITTDIDRSRLQQRAKPRRPDFLVESLKRAGLFSSYGIDNNENVSILKQQKPEKKPSEIEEGDTKVERLNLSNLVSVSQPSTDRTDNTLTDKPSDNVVFTPISIGPSITPVDSARSVISESHTALPHGWLGETEAIDKTSVNTGNRFISKPLVPSSSSNLRLMTPADFIGKSGGSNLQRVPSTCDNVWDTVSVASQSVTSTPSVVCQISDHGHPLSQTRSFKVSDFKSGEITPRSTSGCTTPRDQIMSLGFETLSSTEKIEREIISIRNRLKMFDQKKKKLRTMQKQLRQLTGWLHDLEQKGQSSLDDDAIKVKQEIEELTVDTSMLKKSVEAEKQDCTGLVDRVKELMTQLNTT